MTPRSSRTLAALATLGLISAGVGLSAADKPAAQPASPSDFPKGPTLQPIDTSLFVADGFVKPGVVKTIEVLAPPLEVFKTIATAEGLKSALQVDSRTELRIGGAFELFFGKPMGLPPGQQGSEGCQILSYVPGEMFSFSWNAPPKFPKERAQRTWVVITFSPRENGAATHVRLVHLGFGEGGNWPEVQAYFDNAWGSVLQAVRQAHGG